MVSVLGEKTSGLVFFFFLLFLASKNYGSRASKRAKGRLIIFFPLSFFSFKYLLHTRGKKKKTKMAERTACKWGAKKKGGGQGWRSCRQGTNRKQRRIKKRGGRGAERGSPRQKSKQRWLQERHFSATCRKKRNRISHEPTVAPAQAGGRLPGPRRCGAAPAAIVGTRGISRTKLRMGGGSVQWRLSLQQQARAADQ